MTSLLVALIKLLELFLGISVYHIEGHRESSLARARASLVRGMLYIGFKDLDSVAG